MYIYVSLLWKSEISPNLKLFEHQPEQYKTPLKPISWRKLLKILYKMTFGLGAQFVHEPQINFAFMLRSSALTQQISSLFIWILKLLNLDHLYFQMFLIQNGQPLHTCWSYHLLLKARWDGTVLDPGISTKASGDIFDKHHWGQGVSNLVTK